VIELVVLASEYDMSRIDRPVNSENTVEMVNFVLEKLRKRTLSSKLFLSSLFINKRHLDGTIPLDVNKYVGKRKAIVPEAEFLSASFDDGWIDQGAGIVSIDKNYSS